MYRLRFLFFCFIVAAVLRPGSVRADRPVYTPSSLVAAYIDYARQSSLGPDYLYTKETVESFATRPITESQIAKSVEIFEGCRNEKVFIDGDYAVVRYDILPRTCWPFLLVREDGFWRLDFVASRKYMANNQNNKWFFKAYKPPPHYAFAFKDWYFDHNGFPLIMD